MSLLSGIKFVPREKREVETVKDNDRGDNERSAHDRERKEHKRKHEKHSKHHKSRKSSKDERKDRDHKHRQYESDDSSSVDMNEIAQQEMERERQDRLYQRDLENRKQPDNDSTGGAKKFDPNHFRSLMDSLRKPQESSTSSTTVYAYESDDGEDQMYRSGAVTSVAKPIVDSSTTVHAATVAAPAVESSTGGSTNQSVAAMLRARLQQSKTHLVATPAVSIAPPSANNASGAASDYSVNTGVDREAIALRNRYHQQISDGNPTAPGQSQQPGKKRRTNLPGDLDADTDINTLKGREKAGGDDIDAVFRDNILRLGERYKGTELGGKGALGNGDRAGMDEEGEIDMSMFQRKEQSQADILQREAQRAMKAQQQLRKTVESCRRCTESRTFLRSTVISQGENAVLRMKTDPDVLVEGHLEIIPISHVSSILQCDEETQKEISKIQNSLRRLYEKQGKGVLFLETAVHFHSRPHAHIDVIPIEAGMEDEASMFFKEAFFSCDEEWAQHKKVIELTSARPLRRAVPTHFQYLAAEWGDPNGGKDPQQSRSKGRMAPYGGIAHPVESEGSIDTNFCLDVVAGMLDLEPLRMRRGAKNRGSEATASGERVEKAVAEFRKQWDSFAPSVNA